ncbi:MAG TPA: c-type cytochrome [Blastocatellia bacterium]|nr:c-type cytochrome [Blastocatellia bacterium]
MNSLKLMLVGLYVMAFVLACNSGSHTQPSSTVSPNPIPSVPSPTPGLGVLEGCKVFQKAGCATCHGYNGEGMARLTRSLKERRYSLNEFTAAVYKKGKVMPSYKGILNQKQICCLYSYVTEIIQGGRNESQCEPCQEVKID